MTQLSLSPNNVDLTDAELFERNEAHDVFRMLRREAPVHWNPANDVMKGFWNVTKYADVVEISRNPELFISSKGITQLDPVEPSPFDAAAQGFGKMLITMDPPRHVRLRRLVNKGFTPRAVGAMEMHIREIVTGILDDIAAKGECDFVTEVAAQLPLAVICEMMGLPKSDWQLMFELTNKVLGGGDPEYQTDVAEDQRGTVDAARQTILSGTGQMFGYFAQCVQSRRKERKDDLVSLLCDSEIDGEALSDEEILFFSFLLIVAGNETTRNAISGGLLALSEHPAEKQRLLDNPALIGTTGVEEILRWTSPVAHMARVATRDTVLRGQQIKEGQRLTMWYGSVNRDEDMFPDPYRFDVTRSPNEHLAFGIGEHFCLGAGFARLELKVIFEELLRRFPDVELAGPVERLRSAFIAGIKHLPVRYQRKG